MSDSGWGLAFLLAVAAAGYESHAASKLQAQVNDLQTQLDDSHSQMADVKEKVAQVTTASDELKANLERFQNEDWADVMPDAQSSADDLDTAKDDLQSATDDADGG